jgi:hypothetical protein
VLVAVGVIDGDEPTVNVATIVGDLVAVAAGVRVALAGGEIVAVREAVAVAVGTGGVGVSVSVAAIVLVGVATSVRENVASSKTIDAGSADTGLRTIRALADCASAGASMAPVDISLKPASGTSSVLFESAVESAEPEPSALAYQETRSHAASTAGSPW